MAGGKKHSQPLKKRQAKAVVPSRAVSGKLTAKERGILKSLGLTGKQLTSGSLTLASQVRRNKVFAKIVKALSDEQQVNIPSKDYADRFIEEEKIKIDNILIDKKHDHLFFILNNGLTIQEKISKYPLLKNASEVKLKKYKLYAGGTCVEWNELDEDLSLRGLLKETVFEPIKQALKGHEGFVLAAG
jgi:hypothetical protein